MPAKPVVLLFSEQTSARLTYSASYLLETLLGVSLKFSNRIAEYEQFTGPKIYYAKQSSAKSAIYLKAHPLIYETTIETTAYSTSLYQDLPIICHVPPGGTLPFDPFAATFYLLSRYEEYQTYEADAHNRFAASLTWAHRVNHLDRPIIWEWARLLWQILCQQSPQLRLTKRTYIFQPTYDVDLPWAFLYRGGRGLARAGLDLVQGQWAFNKRRIAVWAKQTSDPFFTFPYLHQLHQQTHTRPRIFWLVAAQRSRYDVNPNVKLTAFKQLVQNSQSWADIGLHPSYASNNLPDLVAQERQTLTGLSGQLITHSRQHYLRLNLPHTYRQLIAAGIRHDYTMGFADAIGYRAGTSEPFYWFDLEKNKTTDLLIHPFLAMDVTLRKYIQLSPDLAAEKLHSLQNYCRTHGLTFTTLWHNSSFSELHGWTGWKEVYEGLFNTTSLL